jgi:D-alanyl-D-alanine-carboxypeptidase/D-alanyl-D-alanine-endopeptidase
VTLLLTLLSLAASFPPPQFSDPDRPKKLAAAFPEVDRLMTDYATKRAVPGMVWGVVIDGRLAHFGGTGIQSRTSNRPVSADSVFRIASMTKSFTALCILRLRDQGKLSLEDPVTRWIPEFAKVSLPTSDSGPIRIRHLMTHAAGLPEDNPWGDQQLGISDEQLTKWLSDGIPFSTAPGTRYEYSNYAFALLGRVITSAAGVPYSRYLKQEILTPLGMTSTTLEGSEVPPEKKALGYRLRPDGQYQVEEPLAHGAFGAMGGLWTSANDLAKYVAFHLNAFPARDGDDPGPVSRASVREMNSPAWFNNLVGESSAARFASYGYGLGVSADCRFDRIVSHGGGLPGFGSHMAWLPEYGIGMFVMGNLTYSGASSAISDSWNAFLKTGALRKREIPASPMLEKAREVVAAGIKSGNWISLTRAAAPNLFLDTPAAERLKQYAELRQQVGLCSAPGPIQAENWLRGQFDVPCERGTVGVFVTLAPTKDASIQHLSFRKIEPGERLGAPTSSPYGVSCAP